MSDRTQGESSSPPTISTIRVLQGITVLWMSIELTVGLAAGIRAHSVALTAFAADSGVELLSAIVVLRRFHVGPKAERQAARTAAFLLYILAAYIVVTSVAGFVSERFQARSSPLGIALLLIAGIAMPLLGRLKRDLAVKSESAALKADAAQTNLCAYMSWISLIGVTVNSLFHIAWADSLSALFLLPFILSEAREAWKGKTCEC